MSDAADLDDIFSQLKNAHKSIEEEQPETLDSLKKKINKLPKIETHATTSDVTKRRRSNNRSVQKVNDPIEAVLPGTDKVETNPKRLKELRTKKWFAMSKPEMTEELQRDLTLLQNRQYLDPKRFYKGEKWKIPENFQVGTIVSGVGEYAGDLKKSQKGRGFAEELLKDDASQKWFKKTYTEIAEKNAAKVTKRKTRR